MSLFSGLETLGFDTNNINIYEKKKDKPTEEKQEEQITKQITYKEEDYLFQKSYSYFHSYSMPTDLRTLL